MTKEALKLALEALNDMACWQEGREVDTGFDEPYAADTSRKAITAIEEALAQPEQEPAAWRRKRFSPELGRYFEYKRRIFSKETDGEDWTPLYTTPPQRKPLSDEEIKKIWYAMQNIMGWYSFEEVARAIEAAHYIKE